MCPCTNCSCFPPFSLLHQAVGQSLATWVSLRTRLHGSLANVLWVLCWVLLVCVHVLQALLRETSKNPLSDAALLQTTEVSLTALTQSYGFYHPVSTQLSTRLGSSHKT